MKTPALPGMEIIVLERQRTLTLMLRNNVIDAYGNATLLIQSLGFDPSNTLDVALLDPEDKAVVDLRAALSHFIKESE